MSQITINGFEKQISCKLRVVDGSVVLRGCPFYGSEGHGDAHCLLLMLLEQERLQKAESDEEIIWKYEDILHEIFCNTPLEERDYSVLSNWKFKDCPMVNE